MVIINDLDYKIGIYQNGINQIPELTTLIPQLKRELRNLEVRLLELELEVNIKKKKYNRLNELSFISIIYRITRQYNRILEDSEFEYIGIKRKYKELKDEVNNLKGKIKINKNKLTIFKTYPKKLNQALLEKSKSCNNNHVNSIQNSLSDNLEKQDIAIKTIRVAKGIYNTTNTLLGILEGIPQYVLPSFYGYINIQSEYERATDFILKIDNRINELNMLLKQLEYTEYSISLLSNSIEHSRIQSTFNDDNYVQLKIKKSKSESKKLIYTIDNVVINLENLIIHLKNSTINIQKNL